MHPAVVLLANVRNGIDVIEGAQYSGSSCGVHKERYIALGLALHNQTLQLRGDHSAVLIRWHHDAVISAKAADSSARLDGIMTLIRSEHDQCARQSHGAVFLVVGEHLVACSQKSVQIRNGATWSQYGITTRPANDLTHLRQHHVLHEYEYRSDLVCEHVGIRCRRQPFASHGDQIQAARQLIEEVRMACGEVEIWKSRRA